MNIQKNRGHSPPQGPLLTSAASRVLHIGLVLIYGALFGLLFDVQQAAPFTTGAAAYYGRLLEYPLAALMLLTGATILIDRVARERA